MQVSNKYAKRGIERAREKEIEKERVRKFPPKGS